MRGIPESDIKKVNVTAAIMPQLNFTRHGLTTYMKYKGMVAWGWDVSRLIVRYEVIHATKGQIGQS